MDQLERPVYYEGEYLGADDLAALVRYAREGQSRQSLGAHVWGIAVGLDLVERALPGGDVEIVLTPGLAWDGYGRTLLALAPRRLPLDLFAGVGDTPAGPIAVEVWLVYRELPARPPAAGFACPDEDRFGRAVETFGLEVRRAPLADSHSVIVAGRSIPADQALHAFNPSKPALFDESVAAQELADGGDRQRWPLFAGVVRWRKDVGVAGRLIARTDPDRDASRAGRRYIGAVAETILAPDGVLRLRDRSKDPNDPVVNYRSPVVGVPGPDPANPVVNDLVWCEGHLRVVGDTRLQAGKLDYRVKGGSDDGVKMYLRRITDVPPPANPPKPQKTTLEAFIGPPPAVPANAETRFAVSSGTPAAPAEILSVVTDGRVGVNSADPTNTLQVQGPSGIRYGFGYLTGDAAGWSALGFNAFNTKAGGPWKIPDLAHPAAAIVFDESPAAVPEVKIQSSPAIDPPVWTTHVTVKGDSGNVGIGTVAPAARLHVAGKNHLNAVFDLVDAPEHLTVVVGTVGSGLRFSATNEFFIASQPYANKDDTTFGAEHLRIKANGDVGIGTTTPAARLQVVGNATQNGTAMFIAAPAKGPNLSHIHWDPTGDWYIRSAAAAGKVVIQDSGGNVGIGTSAPGTKLHVQGNRIRLSGAGGKRLDLRADGASVDLHSETDHLYIRTAGDAAHPGKRNVVINPDNAVEGNVGIGTAAPASKLHVVGDMQLNGDMFSVLGAIWTTSDRTQKDHVYPLERSLDVVRALRGVSFTWRTDLGHPVPEGSHIGFIAQDVEAASPGLVKEGPSGLKAINMSGVQALAIEAMKELADRCERLEADIAALRAQLSSDKPAAAGKRKRPTPKKPA